MSDIREALEMAAEEVDSQETETTEVAEIEEENTLSPDDNTGTEESDQTNETAEQGEQGDQPTEEQTVETTDVNDQSATAKTDKAPAGWTPANREHWASLPNELKQQISKREREVNDVLQNSVEARKQSDFIGNLGSKYQNVMQSEGINDPMQAVQGMFETVSVLTSGNPQLKAKRMAEMIGHYGIDINALDDVLSGNMQGQQEQQQQADDPMMKALDARLAPMQQMFDSMQNQQQQQQQQQTQNVNTEIQNFEKSAEFINDVRADMADLLDMSASRGVSMSLKQAYDKAVALNPEISKVIADRKMQEDMGIKRQTASSLNGQLGGGGSGNEQVGSLRDTLEGAWAGEYD